MRSVVPSKTLMREGAALLDRQPSANPVADKLTFAIARPVVRGKFLFVGDQKYWVKGVTYGTFRPADDGRLFPDPQQVDRDFVQMRKVGINTVRVYTPPPRWLLDAAHRHRLRVMVGLPWTQHIAFLDDPGRADLI